MEVIGTGEGEYVTFVDIVEAMRDRLGNMLEAAWERQKGDNLESKETFFNGATVYFEKWDEGNLFEVVYFRYR